MEEMFRVPEELTPEEAGKQVTQILSALTHVMDAAIRGAANKARAQALDEAVCYVGLHLGSGRIDYVPDRRKGERRKVDPVVLTENFPGVKLFTRRDGYVRIDRRTGTNRRSRG